MRSNAFWTLVGLVGGFLIALIFYVLGNKEHEPVYAIIKEPSLVFDKNNVAPSFRLLDMKDSTTIKSNVYVASILIWNNGDLPIIDDDIRKEFTMRLSGSEGKILDYKIVKESREEITKFQLIEKDNKLQLDWAFFDPGDALEIQLTYTGNRTTEVKCEGFVLGAELKKVVPRGETSTTTYLQQILAFVVALAAIIAIYDTVKKKKAGEIINVAFLIQMILLFFLMAIIIFWVFREYFSSAQLPSGFY